MIQAQIWFEGDTASKRIRFRTAKQAARCARRALRLGARYANVLIFTDGRAKIYPIY